MAGVLFHIILNTTVEDFLSAAMKLPILALILILLLQNLTASPLNHVKEKRGERQSTLAVPL